MKKLLRHIVSLTLCIAMMAAVFPVMAADEDTKEGCTAIFCDCHDETIHDGVFTVEFFSQGTFEVFTVEFVGKDTVGEPVGQSSFEGYDNSIAPTRECYNHNWVDDGILVKNELTTIPCTGNCKMTGYPVYIIKKCTYCGAITYVFYGYSIIGHTDPTH